MAPQIAVATHNASRWRETVAIAMTPANAPSRASHVVPAAVSVTTALIEFQSTSRKRWLETAVFVTG